MSDHYASLASSTATAIESASKHNLQCRVATDIILQWVSTQDGNNGVESAANIVKSNKMKYCMHKNDIVVGVRNGWKKDEIIGITNKAYPHVLTTYSGLTLAAQYFLLRLYNNSKTVRDVDKMVYNDELKHRLGHTNQTTPLLPSEQLQIDCMPQFYFQVSFLFCIIFKKSEK